VRKRAWKRWLWTVMCRRTRQLITFVIGDHSERTCRRLWHRIPQAYRGCFSCSDFWQVYAAVFPVETHRGVGKETGETSPYGTLEQHLAATRGPLCTENLVVLEIGSLAFSDHQMVHYYL
jgi:IS1 family transposase